MEVGIVLLLISLLATVCAMVVFSYKYLKELSQRHNLEIDIKDLQQIIYRKIEQLKEQQHDIKVLLKKDSEHKEYKDVVKKWNSRFYERDNFTWAENPYKQGTHIKATPINPYEQNEK